MVYPITMLVTILGSMGTGLVWGWLMGNLAGRGKRTLRNGLALSAATIPLAISIVLLADWRAMVFFLGAMGLALLFHLGWRQGLRDRFSVNLGAKEDGHA